ncbi:MAG: 16S rRNA (adenine(1518)-N(6)/adenine(1519)-N(6))-dimethyltransferase RsmA [Oscillospiraceae bacterium]|nr:16S rRNA (adenine(1518)-N(6)/adenine(1519)-N(6))-dimethyltransferase RsmA [Oscillospiraceae bacterium]
MRLTDINDIKKLLSSHGFRFSKSMGQNFLTAAWVPEDIADAAQLDENTGVLEVGPGIGCLTEQLSMRAGKVVAVELDNALRPVLKETLDGKDNVEIVFGDVLKQNIKELVNEKMSGMRHVVCANLPYNVTSPLITAFLEAECFDTVTVMIQREVARRICARPGTADYGAFTVLVNWYAEPEMLFDVPPSCFIPQPKVTSSVIRLKMRSTPPVSVKDRTLFFRVVRAAFGMRRKTLTNALGASINELGKPEIEKLLSDCGFDPKIRGEVLSIGDFAKISDAIFGLIY